MAKPRKKKRQAGKRQVIETALPKRQYKRTNRLLYVFSAILLVVFGGGAALIGRGRHLLLRARSLRLRQWTSRTSTSGATGEFTTTPTPVPPTSTPTP